MIYFQSLTKDELAEKLYPISVVRGEHHFTPEEIEKKKRTQARVRAKQIFVWVYKRYVLDFDKMSDVAKDVRAWLKENVSMYRLTEKVSQTALDGTHKFLWTLPDQKTIESVIIPAALKEKDSIDFVPEEGKRFSGMNVQGRGQFKFKKPIFDDEDDFPEEGAVVGSSSASRELLAAKAQAPMSARTSALKPALVSTVEPGGLTPALTKDKWGRLTACISSQVGCAMACKFCLTGIQGLDRSLETHEIVAQILELRMRAPITNIVFMGMGEPMNNFENVVKACNILLDVDGLMFSKRKITISTSGLVPQIIELGKRLDVSLAISLNASNDEQRTAIMPVNKKWPIAALLDACRTFPLGPHRRITFEYVMIRDFNDSIEDAKRLVRLLADIPNKINLIPMNEHPGSPYKRPSDATVHQFQKYLLDHDFTATVRISRGSDILAACGQLKSLFGTAKGTHKHESIGLGN